MEYLGLSFIVSESRDLRNEKKAYFKGQEEEKGVIGRD